MQRMAENSLSKSPIRRGVARGAREDGAAGEQRIRARSDAVAREARVAGGAAESESASEKAVTATISADVPVAKARSSA
jgi:hypothetical protein